MLANNSKTIGNGKMDFPLEIVTVLNVAAFIYWILSKSMLSSNSYKNTKIVDFIPYHVKCFQNENELRKSNVHNF